MKKSAILISAFFLLTVFSFAQTQTGSLYGRVTDNHYANMEIQIPVIEFIASAGIIKVHVDRLENGRNLIATDRKTQRQLYVVIKKDRSGTSLEGFMVRTSDGKWTRFDNSSSGPVPGDFGCPDNWLGKLICYTHPVYNVTVCYTRCTPKDLVFELPSGL